VQMFNELQLTCRDIGRLVGLDRHLRSSKKRSIDGDLIGLKSMNVFRTMVFDNDDDTPATSLQLAGACASPGGLELAGASNPRAATGALLLPYVDQWKVASALDGAVCNKSPAAPVQRACGGFTGPPRCGGFISKPAAQLPNADLPGEVLKINALAAPPPLGGPKLPALRAPDGAQPPPVGPLSRCCIACSKAAPAFLYEFSAC
jgi:hypothetical protein